MAQPRFTSRPSASKMMFLPLARVYLNSTIFETKAGSALGIIVKQKFPAEKKRVSSQLN
jgi:hypothetical protein